MKHPFPLGNMSAETFLRDYWQKKPLLIRKAFADFQPPVDGNDLAGLALEECVESRLITQDAQGENWDLQHGPFDEATFNSLPDSHWTLLVQAVDHWIPEAHAFLEQFRFIPQWRIDDLMISYATKGGGVGPHYDNYDVFLIQASGQRRWEIGGIYGEDSPRKPDTPVMILPEWQAEESYLLEPGDMLYLPPRVGHNGWAESDDCMTYSVGFRAPSHAEILRSFTDHIGDQLKSETRYADPDLQLQEHTAELSQAATNKVRQLLKDYIEQPNLLENWFGQYMTDPKYPEQSEDAEDTLSSAELREYLAEGGVLYRSEGSRYAFRTTENDAGMLFVNGKSFAYTADLSPLVLQLVEVGEISQENITSDAALNLCFHALQEDALYIEEM